MHVCKRKSHNSEINPEAKIKIWNILYQFTIKCFGAMKFSLEKYFMFLIKVCFTIGAEGQGEGRLVLEYTSE